MSRQGQDSTSPRSHSGPSQEGLSSSHLSSSPPKSPAVGRTPTHTHWTLHTHLISPIPSLMAVPRLTLLQPHGPLRCSPKTQGTVLPQDFAWAVPSAGNAVSYTHMAPPSPPSGLTSSARPALTPRLNRHLHPHPSIHFLSFFSCGVFLRGTYHSLLSNY